MMQNLQDEILQEDEHTIKATKDTSQTQECYQLNTDPKDGFLSSGLALTPENLRALQRQQFALFSRSKLLNRPGVDESFHTDFLQSYYTAGKVNIALLLGMFEYRVQIIETIHSGDGSMFERVSCDGKTDQNYDDFSNGPATLVNHVDSCIFWMYRMCTFSSGKRVRFLDSRVESVLQDFSRRQRQVWKRESSVTLNEEDARIRYARSTVYEEFLQETIRGHDSVSCRALLVGIALWIMTFDTASLEDVDRLWRKVQGTFDWTYWGDFYMKNRETSEQARRPDSMQKSWEGLGSKINRQSFEDKCNRFGMCTPSDPQTRDRLHTALSEGILQNILLKLDDVPVNEEQLLRALRKEIADDANDMLRRLDQAKDLSTRFDVCKFVTHERESPAEDLYYGLQWVWRRRLWLCHGWFGYRDNCCDGILR